MSKENPTYKATYRRPREVWRDAWIQCEGHRIYYRLATESGFCMIAQWLKAQGKPDGDIVIQEVGAKPQYALRHYLPSIDRLADPVNTAPTVAKTDTAAITVAPKPAPAVIKPPKPPKLPSDTTVVKVVGKPQVFSAPPPPNKFVFVEVEGQTVRVNPAHRVAFEIVMQTPGKWEADVHSKTRAYLVEQNWITVANGHPSFTNFGRQVAEKVGYSFTQAKAA